MLMLFEQLLNGLQYSALLFLLSAGLTLVFGIMNVINLTHGSFYMVGAFCAAAALPHLHPEKRRTLLQSISEAAATAPGWSNREPAFFPEWVDKVEIRLPN